MLDECLCDVTGVKVIAGGPAIRCRRARDSFKKVARGPNVPDPNVWRWQDRPRGAVPMLDQGLRDAAAATAIIVIAHGPAIRRRNAGYTIKIVSLSGAGVGRGDDRPARPRWSKRRARPRGRCITSEWASVFIGKK